MRMLTSLHPNPRNPQVGGMMREIVINACYGGFSISKECAKYMAKKGHKGAKAELYRWNRDNKAIKYFLKTGKWNVKNHNFLEIDAKYHSEPTFHGYGYSKNHGEYKRDDLILIEAIKKLGKKANGSCADLSIVKIPNNVKWSIEEYDGNEWIAEKHRTWN